MGKTKHKISNWKEYNQALANRILVTFCIDLAALKAWRCLRYHGQRGRGFIFLDTEIETALMVKCIFKILLC
ncbi:Mobile element protein [Candidatus Enterovibrio escicola]|uniref:Mobile element protein n=1 Tax=Candidatus Enterovibrio escicola TaxID=1927127 RepID=A0A2A5T3K6_9GAMM|nr:Mobile element protein [Candidatus Enterovibrio escacola]